jgi:hypothetical protein
MLEGRGNLLPLLFSLLSFAAPACKTAGSSGKTEVSDVPVPVKLPVDGESFPIAPLPAGPDEQEILLRLKPHYGVPVKYDRRITLYAGVVGEKGFRTSARQNMLLSFVDSGRADAFVRKTETSWVDEPRRKSEVTELVTDRGRIEQILQLRSAPSPAMEPGLDEFAQTDLFPAAAARPDESWQQVTESSSSGAAPTAIGGTVTTTSREEVTWRLAGVAEVRGHRCAVLEGRGETSTEMETTTEGMTSTALQTEKLRIVRYFDPEMGIDVETVTTAKAETVQLSFPTLAPQVLIWQAATKLIE